MKRWLVIVLSGGLFVGIVSAQDAKKATAPAPAAAAGKLESVKQKASYGLGMSLGRNFKSQGVDLDIELMVRGLRDGLSGGQSLLADAEIEEALRKFQEELVARQEEQMKALAAESQKKGEAFLAANAKKPGVKATASGLQYKVLTEGTGAVPKASDNVKVHYKGTLTDGTVFDSSYERGEPATFGVTQVIKGWVEALQLMKVGSKWQITIPAALAYGATPPPGSPIPPNSVLVFDVELLGIEKAPATKK